MPCTGAGRYQVTGNGGSIRSGDVLIVTLKGSRDLSQRLTVEKVRHLINPPGQWMAVASGPVFHELEILNWQVACDSCGKRLDSSSPSTPGLGEAARSRQPRHASPSWAGPARMASTVAPVAGRRNSYDIARLALVAALGLVGCATEPLELQRDVTLYRRVDWRRTGDRPHTGLADLERRACSTAMPAATTGSAATSSMASGCASAIWVAHERCAPRRSWNRSTSSSTCSTESNAGRSNIDQLRLWPGEARRRLWPELE